MKEIDRLIKKFEPMMHSRLRHFKIAKDYEDNLQKLRMTTADAIGKYNENSNRKAQLSTYIFRALTNKLQNILRQDYGTICGSAKASEEEKLSNYNLKNLDNLYVFPKVDQIADKIRLNSDFNYFCTKLNETDRKILNLKIAGNNQSEIAKITKMSQAYVSLRLKATKERFKKFLNRGDTNA